MKNLKLIHKLLKIPMDAEICIFDYKKNITSPDADDESSDGIYPDFDVEAMDHFVALSFDNREDID